MNRPYRHLLSLRGAAALLVLLLAPACDDAGGPDPATDTGLIGDADAGDTSTSDADSGDATDTLAPDTETDIADVDTDADTTPGPSGPVEIAFDEWLPAPGDGEVLLYPITSEEQIPEGMSVQARIGDWIFDSGRALYVIEGEDRTMSPCPYGGNVIDVIYRDEEGNASEETLGEICPMLNLGLTFRGTTFEVIEDGSEGRAVLAVSGDIHVLDFLNITAMAGGYLGGLEFNIPLGPDVVRPISATFYYALLPGSNALRVVGAYRNDGTEAHPIARGHLLRSAGQGMFYNPLNALGGYGYQSIGPSNLAAVPVAFQAYSHELGSWGYVPDPVDALEAEFPIGAGSISVSGVTATLIGTLDLFGTLLAQPGSFGSTPGIALLEPGESVANGHYVLAGDGSLSTMIDVAWELLEVPVGTVGGVVRGAGGDGLAGVLVTAVDADGRGLNQARTSDDGTYTLSVPAGVSLELRAYGQGISGVAGELVTVTEGEAIEADIDTGAPVTLRVSVRNADGEPVAARLSVTCAGPCPRPLGAERDLAVDDIPDDFAVLLPVGLDGEVEVALEPGTYGVVVSRGMEWSTWPSDAWDTGGYTIEVEAGDVVALEAEIAHVLDTRGAISGDFHVHALASSDSAVSIADRVWNFVSEGVDVIVSTDHDYIADFAPTISAEGLEDELVSVIGAEVTTSSYGHINAFPLAVDPDHRTGGALDWGNGPDLTLIPAETYAWAHAFPGEQVVQINHPDGAGTIGGLNADVLLGISRFTAEQLGMPEQPVDERTGDTGFWSDDFTAMEVMNGLGRGNFWIRFRWWVTMIGRGFSPAGTAVTDTHKLYSDLGGAPRSFVFVSPDVDTPGTMDEAAFTEAINAGRLIGTNGPYFVPIIVNGEGATAAPGDTVELDDELRLDVHVSVPEWMRVDTIDVFINLREGIYSTRYVENDTPVPPTLSETFAFEEGDRVVVATGEVEHARYEKTVSIPLELDEDAYVIVMVRGEAGSTATLWPVIPRRSEKPFAFSNPIYVDADGGGYDNYPLQELIDELLADETLSLQLFEPPVRAAMDDHDHDHVVRAPVGTREWLAEAFEWANCRH